ncbi:esterase-like activity of phytase family protein [Lentibacter sp.]|uniref:esterase-like activity of phytase family protein n=1 Tax=Lentibacter sp. TaxID=2024994 RepID=UPI003F6C2AEA
MRWRFAVALGAIIAALCGWYWQSGHSDGVDYLSSEEVQAPAGRPDFGGLSGLELRENGSGYALTDRGYLFEMTVNNGGHAFGEAVRLRGAGGDGLVPRKRDSEGLALLADGLLAVSFEGEHRVDLYDTAGGLVRALEVPLAFDRFGGNAGLEALAVAPDGALVAIPERSGDVRRAFPAFVYKAETWQMAELPRRGAFLPVGADFGPDGRLYVLERDYLLNGFRTRIRRFAWDGRALSGEEELLKTRFWTHGNLEGISVRQTPEGVVVELVSDNNFLPIMATSFVRYRVKTP